VGELVSRVFPIYIKLTTPLIYYKLFNSYMKIPSWHESWELDNRNVKCSLCTCENFYIKKLMNIEPMNLLAIVVTFELNPI